MPCTFLFPDFDVIFRTPMRLSLEKDDDDENDIKTAEKKRMFLMEQE